MRSPAPSTDCSQAPVTESWQRTLRACVVMLALAVLAIATAAASAVLVGAVGGR